MILRSLSRKINTSFNTSIEKLKTTLEKVKYLCTTADVWSAKRRSFMDVTVQWIDEDSLERKSACQHVNVLEVLIHMIELPKY